MLLGGEDVLIITVFLDISYSCFYSHLLWIKHLGYLQENSYAKSSYAFVHLCAVSDGCSQVSVEMLFTTLSDALAVDSSRELRLLLRWLLDALTRAGISSYGRDSILNLLISIITPKPLQASNNSLTLWVIDHGEHDSLCSNFSWPLLCFSKQ